MPQYRHQPIVTSDPELRALVDDINLRYRRLERTTAAGAAGALGDLSDVVITTVGDGELLVYDSGSVSWINQTLAEAGVAPEVHTHVETDITDLQAYLLNITAESIHDLSDVGASAGTVGNILQFGAGVWQDVTLAAAGISAVGHTHLEVDITDLQAYLLDITGEVLGDLSNVTVSEAIVGTILVHGGAGSWAESTLADAGISTLGHTHPHTDITDFDAEVNTLADARIAAASIKDLSDVFSTMTPNDGEVLTYDTTNGWQAEVAAGGVTDHGALDGLADDDHTQYALVTGARAFTGSIDITTGSPFVYLDGSTAGSAGLSFRDNTDDDRFWALYRAGSTYDFTLEGFGAPTDDLTNGIAFTIDHADYNAWFASEVQLGGSLNASTVAILASSSDLLMWANNAVVINLDADNTGTTATFQIQINGKTTSETDIFVVEETGEAWALLELTAGGNHTSPEFRISEDSASDWRVRTISGKMTLEALGSTTATGDGVYLDDGGTNNAKLAAVKNITSVTTTPTGDYPYGTLHLIY